MTTPNNHDTQTLARMVLDLHFCSERRPSSAYPSLFPLDASEKSIVILSIPSRYVDERNMWGPMYSVMSHALGSDNKTPIDELFTFKASHYADVPPTSPKSIRIKKFVDGPWVGKVCNAHAALMRGNGPCRKQSAT